MKIDRRTEDLLWLGFGRGAQVFLLLATFRLLTSVLPKEQVGLFFLAQSIAGFTGLIVVNPIGTFLNREMHGWEKAGTLRAPLLRFAIFALGAAVLTSCAVVLARILGWSAVQESTSIVIGAGLFVLGAALANTMIPVFNLLEARRRFVIFTVGAQAVAIGTAWLATQFLSPTAGSWLIGFGAAQALIGAIALVVLLAESPTRGQQTLPNSQQILSFAGPIALANVAVWVLTQGYRPLVENAIGLESLAVIGLGFGLAASITAATETLAHQIYLPQFYRGTHSTADQERAANWQRVWRSIVPLYLSLILFLAGFAPGLIGLLAPNAYEAAATYFSLGVFAEFLRMLGNIVVLLSQSERRTNATVVPYSLAAITTVVGVIAILQFGRNSGSSSIDIAPWLAAALITGQMVALGTLIRPFRKVVAFAVDFKHLATMAGSTIAIVLIGRLLPGQILNVLGGGLMWAIVTFVLWRKGEGQHV